ncbi:hypothetical protein NUKP65_52970 [Klebsiella variicola]|uniref:hypothetical protein n=1 Tax=Klebsiella pneumoniae complex TaxID=3390273 RepID=UPI0021819D37|nr:hypothetical protein [Klebsiella variicola]GKM25990.1 hypothetical protein NUKP65_52970 [Klebsiella variicola]
MIITTQITTPFSPNDPQQIELQKAAKTLSAVEYGGLDYFVTKSEIKTHSDMTYIVFEMINLQNATEAEYELHKQLL